jgi:rfaE bifunctional protein kinase chain/domain
MKERWRELSEIVGRFAGVRVVVAGDLVLDRFWYGAVQRISREAPVPIVRLTRTRLVPGCAANTVWNLAALGARPVPVGVAGQDREGDALLSLFAEKGIPLDAIARPPVWETPTKTRILAGPLHGPKQQLARVDSGEANLFTTPLVTELRGALERALKGAAALILSDYGLGLVEAVGVADYAKSVPISALDSRFALGSFRGLTTATPNEEEFEEACEVSLGEDEALLERAGEALRARMGLQALLVTRGAKGMSLFEPGRRPLHLPVVGSDQVVDVTGAGDTVIAAYVLALSAGASFPDAAAIANAAGGIVVQKHGTATTDAAELRSTLQAWGEGKL